MNGQFTTGDWTNPRNARAVPGQSTLGNYRDALVDCARVLSKSKTVMKRDRVRARSLISF